ncbi:hypothetical protein [Brevibacillus laterosporus]|uniref:hypothetical protein n=1 Tax=Brevibacillus laterosporus TaxID=1465 RepID=UPI000CE55EE8|nr:hypothetical protein [Brevibacillus laterosporus]MBG9776091.1 phage protein [Brevibacillus laterosporus]PPA87655.1 hypothetical protein C4A75_00085 [Brevibacillus laterosporus]
MTIEENIKDVISKKLEDGMVEKLIEEQLEKGINNALSSLFGSYGDATKVIEQQVKSVIVPYLESYDYSDYIVKLDSVLVDVLKNSALEHKKLLTNFKELMKPSESEKSLKVTDLYERWMDYAAKNVNTDNLKIDYDDGASYEYIDVRFEVDYNENRNWDIYEYAVLSFECEQDEEMNFSIRLSRWKERSDMGWSMNFDTVHELSSLRHLKEFEIQLMKLAQNHTKIILDKDCDQDVIQPEAEPEDMYS